MIKVFYFPVGFLNYLAGNSVEEKVVNKNPYYLVGPRIWPFCTSIGGLCLAVGFVAMFFGWGVFLIVWGVLVLGFRLGL